jgi:ABC-2 type transport system ATP-binding protein
VTDVASPPSSPREIGLGGIQIHGLTRRFGENIALKPLDLRVAPGAITGLLGPNGSGKSTLLRVLIGLVQPDAGRATIAGVELSGDGTAVRRRVTYLPGEIGVYGELTGLEHLAWFVRGRGRGAKARAVALGRELELPLERSVQAYSHGMKRQLLLAAALAPEVPVRILDEPTEGLDPSKRAHVLELLKRDVDAKGTTVLFSSHHLAEVEQGCDRILFLNRGKLFNEAEAARVRAGARHMVKLTWEQGRDDLDSDQVRSALGQAGVKDARIDGCQATFVLEGEDSRAALLAFLEGLELPPITSLSYGSFSLQELYRVLYGQEGI